MKFVLQPSIRLHECFDPNRTRLFDSLGQRLVNDVEIGLLCANQAGESRLGKLGSTGSRDFGKTMLLQTAAELQIPNPRRALATTRGDRCLAQRDSRQERLPPAPPARKLRRSDRFERTRVAVNKNTASQGLLREATLGGPRRTFQRC